MSTFAGMVASICLGAVGATVIGVMRLTRSRYSCIFAAIVAGQSMLFGLISGNPNWLSANLPLGLAVGWIAGWLLYSLFDRSRKDEEVADA
jgi:hypothetical protein